MKRQSHYEKKQYFIDHALASLIGFRPSNDWGRFLENIIFIELKRRNKEIYFHKDKKECDFVIRSKNKIEYAIQVCANIETDEVKKREYAGLIEAMKIYDLRAGLILTENNEYIEKVTIQGNEYQIKVMPIWKWLLHRF